MSNLEYKKPKLSSQLPIFKLSKTIYLPNEFDDRELEFLHLEWLRSFSEAYGLYYMDYVSILTNL